LTLSRSARFPLWIALPGIPIAGFAALLFSLEIPRLLYAKSNAVLLALECASLLAWAALVLVLRSRLAQSPGPGGLHRDALNAGNCAFG